MEELKFEDEYLSLVKNINTYFWDKEKGAYIDSFQSGKRNVTRHA